MAPIGRGRLLKCIKEKSGKCVNERRIFLFVGYPTIVLCTYTSSACYSHLKKKNRNNVLFWCCKHPLYIFIYLLYIFYVS
nr:unnamed protein product [uncultured bacterium]